jgi:hypothetical protein
MKRVYLLMAVAILGVSSAASACPFCKDSAPDPSTLGPGATQQPVTAGSPYNLSIYVMLGGLFTLMGFVGRNVVKAIQTVDARNAAIVPHSPRPGAKPNTGPTDIRIG